MWEKKIFQIKTILKTNSGPQMAQQTKLAKMCLVAVLYHTVSNLQLICNMWLEEFEQFSIYEMALPKN
jgi:hypothetical protein